MFFFMCVLKDESTSFLDRSKALSQDSRGRLGSHKATTGIVCLPHTQGPGYPLRSSQILEAQLCLPASLCERTSSLGIEVGLEPFLTWFCYLCFAGPVLSIPLSFVESVAASCLCLLAVWTRTSHLTSPCLSFLICKRKMIVSHMIIGLEVLKSLYVNSKNKQLVVVV